MKGLIKKTIEKYFTSFVYFFRYLRYNIFITIALNIVVGIMDGFGLSMFMPLLQITGDNNEISPESLGNLSFILEITETLGISLNIFTVLIILCLFFIIKGIIKFINASYIVILLLRFLRQIRIGLIKSLSEISYKAFVFSDVGRVQNTMSSEIGRISKAYVSYFGTFEQLIMVCVYIGFAFIIDAQFAVLVTLGGVGTNILYSRVYKITKSTSKAVTNESNFFQGLLIQFVSGFKYLKSTGYLQKYAAKIEKSVLQIEYGNRKIGLLNAMLQSVREPLLIIVVAIVIVVQLLIFEAALGPIILSLLFFYRALSALMVMQGHWNNFLSVSGSMENMTSFQADLASNKELTGGSVQITRFNDSIKIENGFFQYTDTPVLENINLHINKNETIAFVGESGSGKSTLVNILSGLMPLNSGSIRIDGVDSKKLDIKSFQKRIGYITQEAVIFNDDIFNNVTLWSNKNEENILRFNNSLYKAAIDEFINTLPLKEKTLLGNNGINISGGQKQRISIARELYKDIDILIMDEATSALDSETERSIQKNIDELKGHYTIFIVAHRLSTVKNADKIVIMNKGKIIQEGSYKELLNNSRYFQNMVNIQEL